MTQENSQRNDPVGTAKASQRSETNGSGTGPADRSASPSSSPDSSFPTSSGFSSPIPSEAAREGAINKELRRLNRALRALSACNQALGQAGSERELLQQICDIIVRLGGYRMAGIAYAEQDEEKTVRPMAHAGFGTDTSRIFA
jgi:hypothetical protein